MSGNTKGEGPSVPLLSIPSGSGVSGDGGAVSAILGGDWVRVRDEAESERLPLVDRNLEEVREVRLVGVGGAVAAVSLNSR